MKCLYCGQRLALFQRWKDSEFCSQQHRRLYQEEQQRTGLARLVDAQRRFAQVTGVEAAKANGRSRSPLEEEMRGFLAWEPRPVDSQEWGFAGPGLDPGEPYAQSPQVQLPVYELEWRARVWWPAVRMPYAMAPAERTAVPALVPVDFPGAAPYAASGLRTYPPQCFTLASAAPWRMARVLEWTGVRRAVEVEPLIRASLPRARPLPAVPAFTLLEARAVTPSVGVGKAVSGWPLPETLPEWHGFPRPASIPGPLARRLVAGDPFRTPGEWEKILKEAAFVPPQSAGVLRLAFPRQPVMIAYRRRQRMAREAAFPHRQASLTGMGMALAPLSVEGAGSGQWLPALQPLPGDPVAPRNYQGRRKMAPAARPSPGGPAIPALRAAWIPARGLAFPERILAVAPSPKPAAGGLRASPWQASGDRVPAAVLPAFRAGSPLAGWRRLPGQILASFSELMRDSAGLLRLPCEGFFPAPPPPPSVLFPDVWKQQKPMPDRYPVFDDRLAGYGEPVPPAPAERTSPLMIYAAWQGEPVEAAPTALKTALPPAVEVEPAAPAPVQGLLSFDGRNARPFTGRAVVCRDLEVLYPEGRAKPPASGLKTLPEPKALPIKEEAARLAAPFLANWKNTVRLWGQGPSDLKWLTLALPLIVALVVVSAKGRLGGSAGAPAESAGVRQEVQPAASGSLDSALSRQWAEVRRTILDRAAVVLSDDFRAGLGEWEGKEGWSDQWSYDASGFVRTGPLALYRPSVPMENYRLDFLGQIERGGLGWVVRAADIENYYAMKLTVVRPGPLPKVVLEQYAVIGGKEGPHRQVPLPMQTRSDTMYRVRMEVNGDGFTTYVQGQMVDFFSDGRLKNGGVGFFSAKGEQARVRWIEVQHQYDTLGRLCAFLAPMNLPSKDGGSKQ